MARANILVFAVLLSILALVGIMTWDRLNATKTAREWSQHSYDVIGTLKDLNLAVRDAETGQRGFLLTGKEDYLAPYNDARARAAFLQGELQRLTADNPAEQARLKAFAPILQLKFEELAQTVQLRRTDGLEAALAIVRNDTGREYMRQIEATLSEMTTDERSILDARITKTDNRGLWLRWLVAGGSLFSVMALMLAAWLLNRALWRSSRAETVQRKLALRLTTSLDSLSQGVAVFGSDLKLKNWNDCFQVLLALPKVMVKPGTLYETFAELTAEHGHGLETPEQILHGRMEPGRAIAYTRSRTDGHELELRRTSMPEGGFVLTVSDMTERAQAEAVLREAQKMQAIGQLTGGIAHDFNNLLTVILGTLETVRGRLGAEPKLQERLDRATWAAQRGATLTSQLLSFARKQALAPAPVDMAAAMLDLVPLLQKTLGEEIEVRYVECAGLWPALADTAQLESAVLNLALNARDAMPDGGRLTIEVANRVLDGDYARSHVEVIAGDYAMVAVTDTGQGMTPDVQARVFEPFFTTKPDGKGTGLGLAMVFGFVKQSGGHIKIYSEPGEGTTVRIYLPRAIAAAGAVRSLQGAPADLPRGTETVLLVEDETAVREIASEILRDLGYTVIEAANGDQALLLFGEHASRIDVLLSDVVLPGKIRGRDIAERVVSICPEVAVLFMSGYTENSIVHHGRLDDGVHLIGKPFNREQLARKLADVLALRKTTARPTNVVAIKAPRDH
jgi:signal transduction histidine kinase/CHASE3 domain sensor protein